MQLRERAWADSPRVRLLIADTLGCVVAGFEAAPVRSLAQRLTPGPFHWPGAPLGLAPGDAAVAGAAAACWDEACEGLARAHGRPGVAAVAAVLPLVAYRGGTLGEALTAVRFGYEIGGRLGEVLRIKPGMHVDATWPSMGAAAGAAAAIGLDDLGVLDAINLAACQTPASLYLPVAHGATGRNVYLAHAARLGVDCALAVAAGFTVPPGAVEAYGRIVLGIQPPLLLADPALPLIDEGYLKPFAAVRHVHYGAAAAQALRPHLASALDRIETITLHVYREALTYCGNRAPTTPIQAQFSLSFGVAAMLALGDLSPAAYRVLDQPLVRGLEEKVRLVEDVTLSASGARGATLEIEIDGGVVRHTVGAIAGDPGYELTVEDVRAKFARYAGPSLGLGRARRLFDDLMLAPPTAALPTLLATGQTAV